MGTLVTHGASMRCTFGMAPSTLVVTRADVTASSMPAATIMDYTPMTNILPFGMCNSLSNPQVAAATSAASGVLTPQPCMPVIPSPWTPGSPTVTIANYPALNDSSRCFCAWGGVVSVSFAGQATTQVP